jgi:hypothetical protein
MSASLVQLSGIGVENVDLTVDASHTFWKSMYSKHTGFAIEPQELQFLDPSNNDYYGERHTVTLKRQGDLVTDMWLVIDIGAGVPGPLGAGYRFTNDIGRALLEEVQVRIGGVQYDTRFSEYIHASEELSTPEEQQLRKLTGKSESPVELEAWSGEVQRLYVPINFWFTQAYSNALPLVGLYQHDVQLLFTFRSYTDLVITTTAATDAVDVVTNGGDLTMALMVEYVFLENNERNYFARNTHKYMIEQIQHPGDLTIASGKSTYIVDLNLSHPTSELLWMFRKTSNTTAKEYFNFEGDQAAPYSADTFTAMRLLLNNAERWPDKDPLYFRGVTPHRHHTRIPHKQIYTYSFALYPEKSCTEPSGSINFSRIDFARMIFTFATTLPEAYTFLLFARSTNWIKIERGLSKIYYA